MWSWCAPGQGWQLRCGSGQEVRGCGEIPVGAGWVDMSEVSGEDWHDFCWVVAAEVGVADDVVGEGVAEVVDAGSAAV